MHQGGPNGAGGWWVWWVLSDYIMTKRSEISHACQNFKNSEIFRNHFCDWKWKFPRLSWWNFPTLVKFLKGPKFPGTTFVAQNGIFPRLLMDWWGVKNVKNSEFLRNHFWKFPTVVKMEFSHTCQKYFMVPENQKNSKKILKIIQKFPHLPEMDRKCEKCVGNSGKLCENSGINSQKYQKMLKKLQKISEKFPWLSKGQKMQKTQ